MSSPLKIERVNGVNELVVNVFTFFLKLSLSVYSASSPARRTFLSLRRRFLSVCRSESEMSFHLNRNFTIDKRWNWMKFLVFPGGGACDNYTIFLVFLGVLDHKCCCHCDERGAEVKVKGKASERESRVIRKSKFRNEKIGMIFHCDT